MIVYYFRRITPIRIILPNITAATIQKPNHNNIPQKMQQLQHEQEEPIISEQHKHQKKVQNFKQYLVSSGCVQHLIKFLLGVRNKQRADDSVPSDDVLKMFYQYVGAVEVDGTEMEELRGRVDEERRIGDGLRGEIQAVKKEIEEKKAAKLRAQEEKRLREEQQLAKNTKKGGKK